MRGLLIWLAACGATTTTPTTPAPTLAIPARCLDVRVDQHVRGAYFRKVASSPRPDAHGIRVVVRLPRIEFDPAREYVGAAGLADYKTGPLDRPSVYLGGTASGHEVDVGLTWDRVYDPGGAPQAELAFRPYWRTTNGKNEWHQPKVGSTDNVYFRPGETVTMTLAETGRDALRLEVVGEHAKFAQTFEQQGFGEGADQIWKRVSSIDQFMVDGGKRVGLEGRDAQSTRTTARGAAWLSVDLLDGAGGALAVLGCGNAVEVRGGDTAARYDQIFVRTAVDAHGGETLDIVPPR